MKMPRYLSQQILHTKKCARFLVMFLALVFILGGCLGNKKKDRRTETGAPQALIPFSEDEKLPVTVIIDPGHGGHDTGCRANGLLEKDINLQVGRFLAGKLLHLVNEVILTRNEDTFLSLQQRVQIANSNPDALFVSIHVNAPGSGGNSHETARGIETFFLTSLVSDMVRVKHWADNTGISYVAARTQLNAFREQSRTLAGFVQEKLVASTADENRGVKEESFYVLRGNFSGPAILTEIGFLSDSNTAVKLSGRSYQARIANALCDGILMYAKSMSSPHEQYIYSSTK